MPDESDDHEDREDDYQGEHPLEESLKQLHADDSTTVGVGPGAGGGVELPGSFPATRRARV
jgi:hypothetical protein